MNTRIVFLILLIVNLRYADCQVMTVQDNLTAMQLVNKFLGTGVTITSATLTCSPLANGIFSNTNTNPLSLTLDSGAVLTTGRVKTVTGFLGIDSSRWSNANNYLGLTASDPEIATVTPAGSLQRDVCKLDFVFIPTGDSMYLDYVFASEEYPEYNCTQFGDVFGFFVKPTSSSTYTNYANVPGTTIPVKVNSVNNGTASGTGNYALYCSGLGAGMPNTTLYVDNQISNHVIYDGMTKVLKARVPVTPNVTHNGKLVIADITDGDYDSGLFLKSNSLISYPLLKIIEKKSTNGKTTNPLFLIEGCDSGIVKFQRSANNSALSMTATFSGNATFPADFSAQTTFSIPATVTNYSYTIKALKDMITEPNDSVRIIFSAPSISFLDTVVFKIKDFANGVSVYNTTNDTTVCHGAVVPLYSSATDTLFTLSWTPPAGLSCVNCFNPTVTATNGNIFGSKIVNLRITSLGCPVVDTPVTINIQPNPVLSFANSTTYSCKNDSLILSPTLSPSSTFYTYTWASNASLSATNVLNPVAKPSTTQTYTLTVTTSAGCSATASQTVNISNIRAEIDSIRVLSSSCGQSNGSINIYVTSSLPYLPPYFYSINGGTTFGSTSSYTGLSSGVYNLAVKNGFNCRFDTTINVPSGSNPPTATVSITNTSCGLNNGAAVVSSKTGTAPFTYQWKLGATTISTDSFINNKAAGVYILIATDANGCSATQIVSISNSSGISIGYSTTHQSCSLPNGSIIAFPSGGVFPYTYSWSKVPNPGNVNTISNLVAGKYKLTVTDNSGCTKVDSIFIVNSLPPVLSKSSTVASCANFNGTATINIVSGGNPNYTYSWSSGMVTAPIPNTSHSITGLASGMYYVSVTDSKGCTSVDSINVIGTTKPAISLSGTNINCSSNNGTISATTTGGQPGYSYLWSDGVMTQNRTNLPPAIYTVTVSDANGCTATQSFNVGINSNPSLFLTKGNTTCHLNNGFVVANVANARPPITYQWSNGSTASFINNIAPGKYKVTVTDSFGCQKIDSAVVDSIPALNMSPVKVNTTCNNINGSIALNINAGVPPYKITWSDGNTNATRNSLAPGTYNVYVEDSNKCSKTLSFYISPSVKLDLSVNITDAFCKNTVGGITTGIISGIFPVKYLWSSGDTTANISNKPPGTYTLTANDSFNCPFTFTGTIFRRLPPTYTKTVVNPSCNLWNGSISITNLVSSSPVQYLWTNPVYPPPQTSIPNPPTNSSVNSGLDTGTYYLTVLDNYGCAVTDTFILTSLFSPTINFKIQRPNCNDSNGYLVANITGGNPIFRYEWRKNGILIPNTLYSDSIYGLKHDVYSLFVTDTLGCLALQNIALKNITNMTATIIDTPTRCDSITGSAIATASLGTSPYKYYWKKYGITDSTQHIDSLAVGQYKLRILDSNKCIFDTFVNIQYDHYPVLNIDSFKDVTCKLNNGKIYISIDSVVQPIKIFWNNVLDSTYVKTGLSPQNYVIKVIDSFKCVGTITQEINQVHVINVIQNINLAHCGLSNGTISLGVDSPQYLPTYLWSNGSTLNAKTGLNTGWYKYTVTDKNNCQVLDSAYMYNTNFPIVNLTKEDQQCNRGDGKIFTNITTPYGITGYQWSNGQTSSICSNLTPGLYKVTVTDEFGCTVKDSTTIVNIPAPNISFNLHHSKCINGIGSAKANITNAVGGVTYTWYNYNNTDSVSNLNQGKYELLVVDGRGCQDIDSAEIKYYPKPILSLSKVNDNCSSMTGAVFTNISLGTPQFKFLWNTGDTTANLTNKSSGKYIVTLTDSVGCQAIDSVTLTSTPKPLVSISKIDANCNLSNGKAKATITGGKTPYIYNWDNFINSDSIVGLDSGKHIFTIIDSNLCEVKDTIQIEKIQFPDLIFNITNDNCTYKIGAINTTITGGKSPFTLNWSSGLGTNKNVSNLNAGNYTLDLVDSLGCAVSKVATVSDTAGPVVSLNVTEATCGLSNGSITATVSSSQTPLSYFYNNIPSNKDTFGINGGTYILKTIDNRGCIKLDTSVLQLILPLNYSSINKDASCGLNNGKIKLVPTGGKAPYSYIWNGSTSTADSLDNLVAGVYKFTISDSKGCLKSDSITITQKGFPSISFSTTSSVCSLPNGSVTTNVIGGVSPYSYSWSNSSSNPNLANVLSGIYDLTVTDNANCTVSSQVSLTNRGITSVTLNTQQPKCNINNGKIHSVINNAVLPVTYTWSNAQNLDSIVNLSPGTYSLTVTDSLNCTVTSNSILVNQRSPELSLASVKANCNINNGKVFSIVNFGTAPFSYIWSNTSPAANITNLDSGTYTVEVTDALGCKDTASSYVNRTSMLNVSSTQVKSVCSKANGSISLSISGGSPAYSINWSNGETTTTISNKLPQTYTVSVTDIDMCQVVSNINLLDYSKPIIIPKIVDAICSKNNGSVKAEIVGGTKPFNFLWSNGATIDSISSLAPGYYTLKVTDSMGCIDTNKVTINNGLTPKLYLDITNATCEKPNGMAVASLPRGVPPIIYNWSNGVFNDTLLNVVAGKYYLSVLDARGCDIFDSVTILGTMNPVINFTTQNSYCLQANGSATTTITLGTPPFNYSWSNGTTNKDLLNVPSLTYSLTVTDNVGCKANKNVTINEDPNTLKATFVYSDLKCFNDNSGDVTISAVGGDRPYQYKSSVSNYGVDSFMTGLSAGNNSIYVKDNKGCLYYDTFTLKQPPIITISTQSMKNLLCYNDSSGSIEILASGGVTGFSYSWDRSPSIFSIANNLKAGQHIVTVKDKNNCTMTKAIVLTEPNDIVVTDKIKTPNCFGYSDGDIDLTVSDATPPYTYKWSRGDVSEDLKNVTVGKYVVTITDKNNCVDKFNYTVSQPPNVELANMKVTDHTCHGTVDGIIELEGKGGTGTIYQYSIDSGRTYTYKKKFDFLDTGKYYVFVKDKNNCIQDTIVHVGTFKEFIISAYPKISTVALGSSVTIDYDVIKGDWRQINSHLWSPSEGLSCVDCKQSIATPYSDQKYVITVRYNDDKCETNDTVWVYVLDDNEVFVPSAFSPNHDVDMKNEILYVYGNHLIQAHLQIFNRWGELVFEDLNAHRNGWDGNFKGEPASLGVYTYSLKATKLNKKIIERKGSITLLR